MLTPGRVLLKRLDEASLFWRRVLLLDPYTQVNQISSPSTIFHVTRRPYDMVMTAMSGPIDATVLHRDDGDAPPLTYCPKNGSRAHPKTEPTKGPSQNNPCINGGGRGHDNLGHTGSSPHIDVVLESHMGIRSINVTIGL